LRRLHPLWRRAATANFIETLRNECDAIQLDQPDPGAVVGAGDFQRHDEYPRGGGRRLFPDDAGRGCIVSYGSTIFLFLPCLFLLSLEQQITGFKVCLLGLVLGAVEFVSLTLIAWGNRSPDLPIKNYFAYLRLWAADPVTALLPLAGLITAVLYWWLGKRRTDPSVPVQ
jgi:hypothetical protein